jgi:hypothetical protein
MALRGRFLPLWPDFGMQSEFRDVFGPLMACSGSAAELTDTTASTYPAATVAANRLRMRTRL